MLTCMAHIPLPRRFRQAACVLLEDRRFTCDGLLIAADAFAEFASTAAQAGAAEIAREAAALADQLRTEAPRRGPYFVGRLGSPAGDPLETAGSSA